jgi:hypothetical protein
MTTTNISGGTAQTLSLYEEMDPMLNGEEDSITLTVIGARTGFT